MERITLGMSMPQIVMILSENNPGSISVLTRLFGNPVNALKVLTLDSFDIVGYKIWILYKDCCGEDMDKFIRTLEAIQAGAFTKDEVQKNLSLPRAIPFLSDSVKMDEDMEFEMFGDKWNEYIQANRQIFLSRLNEMLNTTGTPGLK